MLRELVSDRRTHRLSVMPHYAAAIAAAANQNEAEDDHSLAASVMEATEVSDSSEVEDLIHDAVVQLFKDAKRRFERTNARGMTYSVADDAYTEFTTCLGNDQSVWNTEMVKGRIGKLAPRYSSCSTRTQKCA
jgi:hypothetical protein